MAGHNHKGNGRQNHALAVTEGPFKHRSPPRSYYRPVKMQNNDKPRNMQMMAKKKIILKGKEPPRTHTLVIWRNKGKVGK
jgi:hypothetical protein